MRWLLWQSSWASAGWANNFPWLWVQGTRKVKQHPVKITQQISFSSNLWNSFLILSQSRVYPLVHHGLSLYISISHDLSLLQQHQLLSVRIPNQSTLHVLITPYTMKVYESLAVLCWPCKWFLGILIHAASYKALFKSFQPFSSSTRCTLHSPCIALILKAWCWKLWKYYKLLPLTHPNSFTWEKGPHTSVTLSH